MATYSFSGAPVFVTVAATGVYDIDAFGAQGGNSSHYSTSGGLGAQEGGNVTLTAGESLEIIVGGAGGNSNYGGGGGGTFVLANTGAAGAFVPILVAGGGGGAYSTTGGAGTVGASGSGAGGSSTYVEAGGGGSGVKSDGASNAMVGGSAHSGGYGGNNLSGAYAGGAGNSGGANGGNGGFGGGGGGGYTGGGGGGGYTGGSDVGGHAGGGGTSFDSGTAIAAQTVAGVRAGNGSLTITPNVACYLSGTLIRTDGGEIAVETLSIGDRVVSWFGGVVRVRGVEHRSLDASAHPRPWDVNPVRIKAGAFGAGLPARDLRLSPDHSVYVDEVLIPIRHLINDATIMQERAGQITYWHVELDQHDVILAEGLPAESYLDTGNRSAFAHAEFVELHPAFGPRDRDAWDALACAPLVEDGPALDIVRARLTVLAAALGTPLPDAFVVPINHVGRVVAEIPAHVSRVHLVSASSVPRGEARRLGAALSAIILDEVAVALGDGALAAGFHAVEDRMRWTNGTGVLLVEPAAHTRQLEVDVVLLARLANAA